MSHSDAPSYGKVTVNPDWKIVIIRSIWYPDLTDALSQSAKKRLIDAGISEGNIALIDAPGSFEIPLLAQSVLDDADGVIAFGIIVQGATHHAAMVANQSAAGCMQVQLAMGKPITYEVLFVDSLDDAKSRSIGPNSKGPIAADTLLSQLAGLAELR